MSETYPGDDTDGTAQPFGAGIAGFGYPAVPWPASAMYAGAHRQPASVAGDKEAAITGSMPAQLGSVAVFAPDASGAWDDGQNDQPGTDTFFTGSDAYAEQNGPSFRIAFASFDAGKIASLATQETLAGDIVSVDVSYTVVNSAGVSHTAELQLCDFAHGPQEWIENVRDSGNTSPDDPNDDLNPAQDGVTVPSGNKSLLGSQAFSFASATPSTSVDTDVTGAVQQAAASGRDLVLGLSIGTIADPDDDVPQDHLENARITVTAIPPAPKPTISNTLADQHLQAGQSDHPFGSVTLGDPYGGAGDTIGITILDADGNGTDADGNLVAARGVGLSYAGPGQYFLGSAGSLAALQTDLDGLSFVAATTAAGQTATFELDLQSTDGSTTDNQNTSVVITTACFAQGTRIGTTRGDVAVEDIGVGDLVLTPCRRDRATRPVIWVGQRRVDIARHARPELVRPIRFAPGALGGGVPARPLILSPDHALHLDGVLVAARQLVNGGSIAPLDVKAVRYFHIELDRHDVLLAEGAEAESYLDTGNRAQFAGGAAIALHATFDRAWHPGSCLPLATDAARVRPIWERLARRAGVAPPELAPIADPGLHLVLPDGRTVPPSRRHDDGRHAFALAGGDAMAIRLRSAAGVPAAVRPWLDDRRRLGVAIAGIAAWTRQGGPRPRRLAPGDAGPGHGWHEVEGDGTGTGADGAWRWTDGDALLTLPAGCVRLEVRVIAAGPRRAVSEADTAVAIRRA